jgi:hypothetical protein
VQSNLVSAFNLVFAVGHEMDDGDKPVWPTWAVGALFRRVRRMMDGFVI